MLITLLAQWDRIVWINRTTCNVGDEVGRQALTLMIAHAELVYTTCVAMI